jgi:predicted kinase
MTSTIHITTGLPGSGKSTFATALVARSDGHVRRVNLDALRLMLDQNDGSNFRDDHEETVQQIQDAAILAAVDGGFDVVIDNTHLTPRLPRRYQRLLASRDVYFVVDDFTDVPVEECIRRDALRSAPVGEDVIRRMHKTLKSNPPLSTAELNKRPAFEPYTPDPTLPPAIICDIDGTLALHNGRGPYDTERCETDQLREPVARIIARCRRAGDRIVLLSGRSAEYRDHTQRWLDAHEVVYDRLWMRPAGDVRGDDVVKGELFDAHIRGSFNVRLVLDDRNRVVDLWRRLGLECWQVDYGNF